MAVFIRLPNGAVVQSHGGRVSAPVRLSLREALEAGTQGIGQLLCMRAAGAELGGLQFELQAADQDGLDFVVSADIRGLPEVHAEDLPELDYTVTVTRTSIGVREIVVRARSADEAQDLADDDAGNHLYEESWANYEARATLAS